jgi:hypothetical protein
MRDVELRELLTPEAISLLNSLPEYSSQNDVMSMVSGLRKAGHSPSLVASVMTQAKLRQKAQSKFGEFASRMLFTEAGLEQASRLSVAAHHANRYVRAGLSSVADLGCGVGADSLAFAAAGLSVTAVDADEITAALATYNLAPFPEARVLHATAEDVDLSGVDAVFLDPARRTSGHSNTQRLTRSEDYSPSLDFAFSLADTHPTGIKLGPGFDRDRLPEGWEAQWVSVNGDVVELGLWSPGLSRPGVGRAALVITTTGAHEMMSTSDSEDAEVGDIARYIFEPDGAVIRARLIGDLAREMGAHMLDPQIAYMSSNVFVETPFAHGFEITERLPLDVKKIRAWATTNNIGALEIKKRGVDIDPAEFRKKLSLSGKDSATLILTRIGDERMALVAQRV